MIKNFAASHRKSVAEVLDYFSGNMRWQSLFEDLHHRKSATIDGARGSSISLVLSVLEQHCPGTLIVVNAYANDLDFLRSDGETLGISKSTIFPAWDSWPLKRRDHLDAVAAQRLQVIQQIMEQESGVVYTTMTALMQPVPAKVDFLRDRLKLTVGETIDLDYLMRWLVDHGYQRTDAVEHPGDWSKRGEIIEVYSLDRLFPIRMVLFDDQIESIRSIHLETKRSDLSFQETWLMAIPIIAEKRPGRGTDSGGIYRGHLCDYLSDDSWTVLIKIPELQDQAKRYFEEMEEPVGLFTHEAVFQKLTQFANVSLSDLSTVSNETAIHLACDRLGKFGCEAERLRAEIDRIAPVAQLFIACQNQIEQTRIQELLAGSVVQKSNRLELIQGSLRSGFQLFDPSLIFLGSDQLFDRQEMVHRQRSSATSRSIESRALDRFVDLHEGDYVVHVHYGIAIYRGTRVQMRNSGPGHEASANTPAESIMEEQIILEFRDNVRLYVPIERMDLIQKYVGGRGNNPELSRYGSSSWSKKKAYAEEAVRDLAQEMIEIQAQRATHPGHKYPPDSEWQKQFESLFPYQETPDQLVSIGEIKKDLESTQPMDRLLCGDVGFGKTEVALRAAFKVIDHGKQVAVLVPTTILAEQHFRSFQDRLRSFPFTVEVLSRFRTKSQQKQILKRVEEGGVDILVGTHRLLGKDVHFKDLGLVIIDEEQRFGVEAKDKLRQMRALVEILTMTATPIPRTLHASLLNIREISCLETPPPERLAVETRIIGWDESLIRNAIIRERNRQGQIYFVHNRVQDLMQIRDRILKIVPDLRVSMIHGQMEKESIETAMLSFLNRDAELLLATTIIESGLDIPNANTIFIHEANRYGLADLHQLRGRVGRQSQRAYAYLIVENSANLNLEAQQRLRAIEEYSSLGSGFHIAMRDLEIRGAGNILGHEQSGHIEAIGYEMYCQLLENAIRSLKKLPLRTALEVNIDFPWTAYLPRNYVESQKLRLEVYRTYSRLRDFTTLHQFRLELQERFGTIPQSVEWMLQAQELRILSNFHQISAIHRIGKRLQLTYRDRQKIDRLIELNPRKIWVIDAELALMEVAGIDRDAESFYRILKEILLKGFVPESDPIDNH